MSILNVPNEETNIEEENNKKNMFLNMDKNNNKCADCGKNEFCFLSINNGICICENCAEEHKKLGIHVSFIRKYNEKFDDYLLKYIQMGGNSRFLSFALSQGISSLPIKDKYITNAAVFYRETIRSEVMSYPPPKMNYEIGKDKVKEVPENYPEFEGYCFAKSGELGNSKREENKPEQKSVLNSISGFFGSLSKTLNTAAEKIKEKVVEMNLPEKILEGSEMAVETVKGVIKGEEELKQEEAMKNNISDAVSDMQFNDMFKNDDKEKEEFKKLEEKLFLKKNNDIK